MRPQDVVVREAEETAVDQKEQEAVEQKESKVDEDAGGEVFDIDLNADAGGDVADDGFGHAVDPDGLSGQSILQQADGGSGKGAGHRIAPRDSEENGNDEWEIEDRKARKRPGEQGLQQNSAQRHQERDGRGKAVLLEFPARCIAASGHRETVLRFVVRTSLLVNG